MSSLDEPALAQPAVVVNPEAGHHEITADPGLLGACERAIEATYAAHPYYAARYGDRGRSFSSSDSGWLVLVAGEGHERATQQIAWLSRVLAARGMPRVLMEYHLGLLAGEVAALGTHPVEAEELAAQARFLREARLGQVDEATTTEAVARFEADTTSEPAPPPRSGLAPGLSRRGRGVWPAQCGLLADRLAHRSRAVLGRLDHRLRRGAGEGPRLATDGTRWEFLPAGTSVSTWARGGLSAGVAA